jgi:hypothetical protein
MKLDLMRTTLVGFADRRIAKMGGFDASRRGHSIREQLWSVGNSIFGSDFDDSRVSYMSLRDKRDMVLRQGYSQTDAKELHFSTRHTCCVQ